MSMRTDAEEDDAAIEAKLTRALLQRRTQRTVAVDPQPERRVSRPTAMTGRAVSFFKIPARAAPMR